MISRIKKRFHDNVKVYPNDVNSSCFRFHEVPYEFREVFITTGYRYPNSSFSCCIRSLFKFNNNEMLNFWTHFIPFLFVLIQLFKFYMIYDVNTDTYTWPLFIYLCTVGFYLSMSAAAHAFNCMSPIARHLCFIVDYMSISIYGLGSAISYKAYLIKLVNKDEEYIYDSFFYN